ncbi:hypothetical protein AWM75_08000 [Aerococcus urinaehominis]|uniref:Uncharacterized protein n=1 Tax=Aerococcus urinaehominis TaxID=128944 RepID=A0A0X8FM85_9LACT|nr:SLC13 family permease [Aerococcus urinaehominis]AMB99913.1 hypothetical protein AWM75_08000 [Aerococcus urinaehominis]SDM43642.1 solute carrier family 13 (sodium-dependent dicarboxylate transporter), member 2/3/5 [Aerococcus urinaehominis]
MSTNAVKAGGVKPLVTGLSFLILLVAGVNAIFHLNLFHLPLATFSLLAIFAACLLLWLFVAIDWPSILCLICLGLLPGLTYGEVFGLSFGNTTFVFLFFTFIVTYALQETSFLKRVTAWAINNDWAQASASRFILAFLTVMLVLACFISPTILFMIAFPLYEEIVHQFGLKKGDKQAALLLVALFVTIAIGTAMTPINHVFAITAMGIYESTFNQAITNFQYMSFAVPAGLAIFLGLLASLKWLWGLDLTDLQVGRVDSLASLPAASQAEKLTVAIFGLVVAMWLLPELLGGLLPGLQAFFKTAGIAFPPMVGALLLALVLCQGQPLVKLQEAISKGVYWPSLLIVSATLSLGSVLANPDFGVISLLEAGLTPLLVGLSPIVMVVVFVSWAGLQTNLSSNLVTTTVVTTILMTILSANSQLAVNGAVLASLVGFMASLAFMTPPAMPYVAIAIGSEWTTARQALVYGLWMLVLSILAASFIAYPLGASLLSHFN